MPYLMPEVGSADRPSAAHTDPYQLCMAVDTSTCQSNAVSHLWKGDLMEMMGETETERDKNQTNMAHLWIWPPYFITLVCWGYVWVDLCPLRSVENDRRHRDREWYRRSDAAKRRGQKEKVRGASNSTGHAGAERRETTCRKQTSLCNMEGRSWERVWLLVFFSTSERRAAAEIMFWPRAFLLGCLLMFVDTGELHPQSSLSSRCPHYSISFHSPWANKGRFSVQLHIVSSKAHVNASRVCSLLIFGIFYLCPISPEASFVCCMPDNMCFLFY